MQEFWAVILVLMLTVFVILDGFDFGTGIIHLFFSKDEQERSKMLQAIGPYWDGNEVWLIAAGGILFFAFPTLYASSFSGFYLPLIMVLWLLIFRGIGLELRSLVDNEIWRTIWDKSFGLASLFLAIFFGAALGNVVRGVNLGGVRDGVSIYEPHNFFTPLWNSQFSPLVEEVGVLDWFTVLLGAVAVTTLTTHGAAWLRFKLSGEINQRMKRIIPYSVSLQFMLSLVSLVAIFSIKSDPFKNFLDHPVLFLIPALALLSVFLILMFNSKDKEGRLFMSSSLFIFSAFITTAVGMFPVLLPSSNTLNPSLTIQNVAAPEYGLNIGLYWWGLGLVLILIYFYTVHRIFKGKLDDNSYEH